MNLEDRVITKKPNFQKLRKRLSKLITHIDNPRRDLTKKETKFIAEFFEHKSATNKWQYSHDFPFEINKMIRILTPSNRYIHWNFSEEVLDELKTKNLIDEYNAPISTKQKSQRNTLELIKMLINDHPRLYNSTNERYYQRYYLDENIPKFRNLSKTGLEIIHKVLLKDDSRDEIFNELEELVITPEKDLKLINKLMKTWRFYDTSRAVEYLKTVPNILKKSVTDALIETGDDVESIIDIKGLINTIKHKNKEISDLVLLQEGKEEKLLFKEVLPRILKYSKEYIQSQSTVKEQNNFLERNKSIFEPYIYNNFLYSISEFKQDKKTQNNFNEILNIQTNSYKDILKKLHNTFGINSLEYFDFFLDKCKNYSQLSVDSKEVFQKILNESAEKKELTRDLRWIIGALETIESNKDLQKLVFSKKQDPKFLEVLDLAFQFYRGFEEPREQFKLIKYYQTFSYADAHYSSFKDDSDLPNKVEQETGLTLKEISNYYEKFTNLPSIKPLTDAMKKLKQNELLITKDLFVGLNLMDDKEETVNSWLKIIDSFKNGEFNYQNPRHTQLEFARFKYLIENEKVQHHIKNNYTFNDFMSIFKRNPKGEEFNEIEKWEIKCVAYESQLLFSKVNALKQKSDDLGRDLLIVPNFSYGYLPFSAIRNHIEGIDTLIGSKVPSTDCHDSKEYISSKFFKSKRRKIVEKQPTILVVDGTTHMMDRDNEHLAARYPDAYVGVSNHVIALNDALGFNEENNEDLQLNYSSFGKNKKDLENLRRSSEFQKTVNIYRNLLKDSETKLPYLFGGINDLGKDLIIRSAHKKINTMNNLDVSQIKNPMILLYSVGVTHDLLPDDLKKECPNVDLENTENYRSEYKENGLQHIPAYFDDSGIIINLDFGFDKYGVYYHNRLENAVQEEFNKSRKDKPKNNLTYALDLQKMAEKLNLKHSYSECSV